MVIALGVQKHFVEDSHFFGDINSPSKINAQLKRVDKEIKHLANLSHKLSDERYKLSAFTLRVQLNHLNKEYETLESLLDKVDFQNIDLIDSNRYNAYSFNKKIQLFKSEILSLNKIVFVKDNIDFQSTKKSIKSLRIIFVDLTSQ